MKKIIALILVCILLVALVACKNNGNNDLTKSTTSTTPTQGGTTSTSTSSSSSTSSTPDDPVVDPTKDFEDVNEKVYIAVKEAELLTSAEVLEDASNVYKKANYGAEFDRVGYNETWSKLVIDGKEYFIQSELLTTQKPILFTSANETVYIVNTSSLKIREEADLNSKEIAFAKEGTALLRIGIANEADSEGIIWSMVKFMMDNKEVIGYASSKYLSTEPTVDYEVAYNFQPTYDALVVVFEGGNLSLRIYPAADEYSYAVGVPTGTELLRVSVAQVADKDGIIWSKVIYEGNEYYVSTGEKYVKVVDNFDASKVFSIGDEYSITLTKFFVGIEGVENTIGAFASENCAISVSKEALGAVSLKEFAQTMSNVMATMLGAENAFTVVEENGLLYFAFTMDLGEDGTLVSVICFDKDVDNNVYVTTFEGAAADTSALLSLFLEYANTIAVKTA